MKAFLESAVPSLTLLVLFGVGIAVMLGCLGIILDWSPATFWRLAKVAAVFVLVIPFLFVLASIRDWL